VTVGPKACSDLTDRLLGLTRETAPIRRWRAPSVRLRSPRWAWCEGRASGRPA
jgi:hypothetical protein